MLAGCSVNSTKAQWPPGLRNMARAVLAGQAYDRIVKADQDDNQAALNAAYAEWQHLVTADGQDTSLGRAAAEQAVTAASSLDAEAEKLDGPTRDLQRAHAAVLYRHALQLDPHYDSTDPGNLNALGYFLAERGTTPADFQESERLVRRSLQLWDQQIDKANKMGQSPLDSLMGQTNLLRMGRAVTRDSLAWALYRQGRYEAARLEQENAIKEAQASATAVAKMDAELYYHLGEIYRALHRDEDARQQYQAALKIDPNHQASNQALLKLSKKP